MKIPRKIAGNIRKGRFTDGRETRCSPERNMVGTDSNMTIVVPSWAERDVTATRKLIAINGLFKRKWYFSRLIRRDAHIWKYLVLKVSINLNLIAYKYLLRYIFEFSNVKCTHNWRRPTSFACSRSCCVCTLFTPDLYLPNNRPAHLLSWFRRGEMGNSCEYLPTLLSAHPEPEYFNILVVWSTKNTHWRN